MPLSLICLRSWLTVAMVRLVVVCCWALVVEHKGRTRSKNHEGAMPPYRHPPIALGCMGAVYTIGFWAA
jgi:hypothetical protein